MDLKGFKLKVRINRKLCLALSGVQALRKFFIIFMRIDRNMYIFNGSFC